MTDNEIAEKYKELEAHYKDSLANFEHHPRQFAYQVRLYKYFKEREEKSNMPIDPSENVVDFT